MVMVRNSLPVARNLPVLHFLRLRFQQDYQAFHKLLLWAVERVWLVAGIEPVWQAVGIERACRSDNS